MLGRSLMMKASGSSAGQVPWTPAQIATALWLDAADNATVFSDAGITQAVAGASTVQQWNDKSGNARHATQLTTTKRPNYTSNVSNSKPGITFNGSVNGHVLASLLPSSVFTAANRCTFAAVYSPLSTLTNRGVIGIADSQYSGAPWALLQQDTATSQRILVNGIYRITQTIAANSFYIILFTYTGSQWTFRLNGTAGTSYTGAIGSTAGSTLWIGSGFNGEWNGVFTEIVAAASDIGSVDSLKLEGYLAHQRGITSVLPSDHPYKINPPSA
jgi:hypothetical protein